MRSANLAAPPERAYDRGVHISKYPNAAVKFFGCLYGVGAIFLLALAYYIVFFEPTPQLYLMAGLAAVIGIVHAWTSMKCWQELRNRRAGG